MKINIKKSSLIFIIVTVVVVVLAMLVSIYTTYDADDKDNEPTVPADETIIETKDFSGYATDNPWDREKVYASDEYVKPEVTETEAEFNIEENREYINVTISEMLNTLSEDKDKAELIYQDTYIRVSGYLRNIDAKNNSFTMSYYGGTPTIRCYVGEKTAEKMKELDWGTGITVYGKITYIGSSYTVAAHSVYW